MFSLIYSLTFLVCAIFALLFGFLAGKKYKWQYSLVKIILTVVSTIIATFLSVGLALLISSTLTPIIKDALIASSADLAFLFASDGIFKALMSMVIAPVIFCPVFFIVRALAKIAKKPLTLLFIRLTERDKTDTEDHSQYEALEAQEEPALEENEEGSSEDKKEKKKKEKKKKGGKREAYRASGITVSSFSPASAILGALCGLLTFFVICIPLICGISCLAAPVATATKDTGNTTAQMVCDITDGISNNAATTAMKFIGGEAIFNRLTTYNVDGHKMSLKAEMEFASSVASAVNKSIKGADAYNGRMTAEGFRKAGADFKNTTLLPTIIPQFFNSATQKWDNGEQFIGISKPNFGNSITPVIDSLLDTLAAENYDTMKEDIPTLFNAAADITEKYSFPTLKHDPMTVLGDEEITSKFVEEFLANDRLYIIVPGITECGLNILSDSIKMHTDIESMYGDMTNDLTTEINAFMTQDTAAEDAPKKLSKNISKAFKNNGINITDDSALALSDSALVLFGNGNTTNKDIESWLAITPITIADLDGNISVVTIDTPAAFCEHTMVVNVKDIHINKGKVSDPAREAAILAQSFNLMADVYRDIKSSSSTQIHTVIAGLGPVLDNFRVAETIGAENTSLFLMGLLQSEELYGKLKMPLTEIYDVAAHINDSANKTSTYRVLLTSLSQTVTVVESAQNNDKAKTDAEVKVLLEDLTPESATTIQKISSPSLMESYGVSERSAEPTSNLVSDVFGNLSNAKETGNLTEEQYDAEAHAVSDMMSIAMNASSSSSKGKSVFGEDSATGITTEDFINRVSDSTVVSGTLVDTVYGEGDTPKYNPLNSSKKLTEAEQTSMLEAMNNKMNETPAENKAELEKTLIAASAIVNFPVVIDANGMFVAVVA
jgi:hypothetical protein